MSDKCIRISLAAALTLTLTAFSPSFAQFLQPRDYQTSSPNAALGGTLWSTAQYFDFSSTSSLPGRTWQTFEAVKPFFGGEKYARFAVSPGLIDGGFQCFEISTAKGRMGAEGPQDAETINADTKLFYTYNTQTFAHTLLNDDFGGTLYSKVRVWAKNGPTMNFSVAAYSTESNNIDFYLIIKSLKFASPDACKLAGVAFFAL